MLHPKIVHVEIIAGVVGTWGEKRLRELLLYLSKFSPVTTGIVDKQYC
jgi:hypothetical protein